MELKFIYWFANYIPDSASVRYRGKYPIDFLKEQFGIGAYFISPGYKPMTIFRFAKAYLSALFFRKKASLIVIQRVHSNFIYSNLLKLLIKIRKSKTVYDLDDADYLEYPSKMIYFFVNNCSAVTVGSNELMKNLSKFNKSIFLNTSPTPDFNISKKHKNTRLTIGWIGCFGGGHKESLVKDFFPALKHLPFRINLIVMGVVRKSEFDFLTNFFSNNENVQLEIPQNINWCDEKEVNKELPPPTSV